MFSAPQTSISQPKAILSFGDTIYCLTFVKTLWLIFERLPALPRVPIIIPAANADDAI